MEFSKKFKHLRQLNIRKAIWLLIAAYLLCILAHTIFVNRLFDFQDCLDRPKYNIEINIGNICNTRTFSVTNHNDFPASVVFKAKISNTTLTDIVYFEFVVQPHQTIGLQKPEDIQEYYNFYMRHFKSRSEDFMNHTIPAIYSGNCQFDYIMAEYVTLQDFETTLYIEFTWFVLILYVVAFAVS